MNLKFNHVNDHGVYRTGNKEFFEPFIKKCPSDFGAGWCCWGNTYNEIKLNGQHLRVNCIVWGGAEQCPIEKSFSDKYYEYQRGDRDWFVENVENGEKIWIPDLVPAQAAMFGFFQSPSSPYRVDPKQYVKIFGLESNPIETINKHIEKYWAFGSGAFDLDFFIKEDEMIIKEEENENYHAVLYKEGKSICIKLKNQEWLNKHKNIEVFGSNINVMNRASDGYNEYTESEKIVLNDRDDSESMKDGGLCVIM